MKTQHQSENGEKKNVPFSPMFQLRLRETNISEEKLLEDLRRVATEFGGGSLGCRLYENHGKYSHTTHQRRFGTWNNALNRAGLPVNNEFRIPKARLLENLERVWVRLGRQPGRRDMIRPVSEFSEKPYLNIFGSWNNTLQAFVNYVQQAAPVHDLISAQSSPHEQRTNRDVNDRLKIRVWLRDKHRCQICGRSPATNPEIILHVDHIKPWSKGGETVLENLQTLCSKCNLGKGNCIV